ncbi:glycoside hydrolase family 2 protein [Colwellia piezophila]|uniref:glycoside hydrolase family 2 protein n=1 Tax=Colwellia piezophila TaxID=211668 RepID=UPI00035D1C0B|nr:glycoside hydrolase family 2 [Colwellia piezophila]
MSNIIKSFLILFIVFSTNVIAQQKHENTVSLNGTWQIIFDKENISRAQKLYKNKNFLAQTNIRNIEVPSVWELKEKDYEGVALYRRTFTAPKKWQDKITHISFDAVNYRAEVYLNDHVVGVHEGGFTPFSFRIDSMLNFDKENVITLRVLGPILLDTDKVIDGFGAMETPQWRGGISGGIWQSVRLVTTGKSYIKDIYVQPNYRTSQAKVTLSTTNFGEFSSQDLVSFEITEVATNKVVVTKKIKHKFQAGQNQLVETIDIPNAKTWSPSSPNLYKLTVSIESQGKISDTVSDRFGLREFSINNKRFVLNGKEIYVKAVFLEGVYPVGIATPVDINMARKEIRLAKEAGFNMIRPWRRPPPPKWLDLADEIGVLVIGSPALECMDLPVSTPDLPNRVIAELKQTILRDRNRASVVMWELYNEVRRPILKQMMAETSMMARDIDPSRLILDESGGWAFGAKVYLPNERDFISFNDVHTYPGPNVTNAFYDKFLGVSYTKEERKKLNIKGKPIGHNLKTGAMSFVSELGYGSYVDFDKVNARFSKEGNPIAPPTRYHQQLGSQLNELLTSQLSDIYATPLDFYNEQQEIHGKANARMIEATRANPKIAGYCVHALTGGDWVMGAGLLDIWRDPKPAVYTRTQMANKPRILTIRTFPRSAYQGEKVRITVKGINDNEKISGTFKLSVKNSQGKTIWQTESNIDFEHAISDLLDQKITTDKLTGTYTVNAEIIDNHGNSIAANNFDFDVFSVKSNNAIGAFAVVDQTGSVKSFLNKQGIKFSAFNNNTSINTPVLVAMKLKKQEQQVALNKQLSDFAKRGGKVTYVQFPYIGPKWKDGVLGKGFSMNMPINIKMKASQGLWGGMSHVVADHPIFKGLPSSKAMQGVYENVRAKISMINLNTKPIVTVVANDNFPDMTLMKRHYKGTGDVWSGSDLSEVKHGKGTLLLSTMRIVPHLGDDPVADTLLLNLLAYITKPRH